MKRFKKIFVNVMALMLLIVSCFGLSACKEDIRTMKLTISVYNYDEEVLDFETVTLTVDLYGHLAPKTVDAIEKYVNDGYYNDTVFYKTGLSSFSSHIMLGDIKMNNNALEMNAVKPQLTGEFEYGGTVGSNLTAKKGSIGLFRSWYAENDGGYAVSNNSMHSGRATWFIPTSDSTSSSLADWFCIFAQFDVNNSKNATALDLITKAVEEYTVECVVYYTGEYDATKADENYGLTAHIATAEDFEELDVEVYNDDNGLVCYNKQTVKVPFVNGNVNEGAAVKIVSAKVK